VTIEVLYFDGCPNHEALVPRLRELLARTASPPRIDLRRMTADDGAAQREPDTASRYLNVHALQGSIPAIADAATVGRWLFGDLLHQLADTPSGARPSTSVTIT
jgi:hypothetical protein